MKRIVNLNDLRMNDIPYVGGKGANLGELTSAGFPVPNAFVLSTAAYDHFLEKSKIADKIGKELSSIKKE
ncbi:MAG: hypothetical protein LBI08_02010, partial [Methanomassiliicoccaceae archaeon]|nr:hypothetical protein [Methanomassiliicoccaceae archaeon]